MGDQSPDTDLHRLVRLASNRWALDSSRPVEPATSRGAKVVASAHRRRHGALLERGVALLGLARPIPAVLLLLGAAPAGAATSYPLRCSYVSTAGELLQADGCAREEAGVVRIAPRLRARMRWRRGLGEAAVGRDWFYVRRDGQATRMVTFEAGPDPFAQGLARSPGPGGIVFVDRRLRPVIATRHDWATPFRGGLAEVCRGCREQREGEHGVMRGGRWGVIDRRGRAVVPTEHGEPASARAQRPAGLNGRTP